MREESLPLQEAIAMAVDDLDGVHVGNRDMVGLYPNHLAILLVQGIDSKISAATASLV